MVTNLSCENCVKFLRTLILMDKEMTEALDNWNLEDSDKVREVIEELWWLGSNAEKSARFTVISPNLKNTFEIGESFLNITSGLHDSVIATPMVQLQLYLKAPIVTAMKNIIESGVGVEDDIFMNWRGRFERARLSLRHIIYKGFDVNEYLSGKKDRVYDTYEAEYGSLKEIFTKVSSYCSERPLFINGIVAQHSELFTELLRNSEVESEFELYYEAVMPWDIVMFERGELQLDGAYIDKLKERVNEPTSIYNDVPTIVEVAHKIPEERCKDMYRYESCIDSGTVEYIKENKMTFDEVLDSVSTQYTTSFFS